MSISKRGRLRRISIKRADAFSGCPVCTFDMSHRMLSIIHLQRSPQPLFPELDFKSEREACLPCLLSMPPFPRDPLVQRRRSATPYSQKLRTIWVDSKTRTSTTTTRTRKNVLKLIKQKNVASV